MKTDHYIEITKEIAGWIMFAISLWLVFVLIEVLK